ncbi:MAG: sigma-70 family RNA polymerase sigma factor [Pirellulales bacterium]|nr:sigma-70 family RNA polymerase sigma factor [Pirellulales bacterium]
MHFKYIIEFRVHPLFGCNDRASFFVSKWCGSVRLLYGLHDMDSLGTAIIDSAKEKDGNCNELGRLAPLWMRSQPVIAAFIHGMVRERHDVEDLVQQVAETCARKFHEFDEQDGLQAFKSWALTIARYEVLRYYKQQKRSTSGFSPDTLELIAAEFVQSDELSDDRLDALRHCLRKASGRSKQLIEMRYFRDLTAIQIADRLGLSSGAVRVALCRSRESLAACIRNQLSKVKHGS